MESLVGQGGCGQAPSAYYGLEKAVSMPTIKQRCDLAVKQAEDRLAKVKEARELLDRNPDLERLLDIMQQSHF